MIITLSLLLHSPKIDQFYLLGKERPTAKDIEDNVVIRCAPYWKQLGRHLKIDQCLLNIIQHDHGSDCVRCCSRMLEEWLQQNTYENATWEILIDAIDTLFNGITGTYDKVHSTILLY